MSNESDADLDYNPGCHECGGRGVGPVGRPCFGCRMKDAMDFDRKEMGPAGYVTKKFYPLLRAWKEAVSYSSDPNVHLSHPKFKEIVALGYEAVPLLVMSVGYSIFVADALSQITGEEAVPLSLQCEMDACEEYWKLWYHIRVVRGMDDVGEFYREHYLAVHADPVDDDKITMFEGRLARLLRRVKNGEI